MRCSQPFALRASEQKHTLASTARAAAQVSQAGEDGEGVERERVLSYRHAQVARCSIGLGLAAALAVLCYAASDLEISCHRATPIDRTLV